MPRKLDKLILYTSCCVTPHYAFMERIQGTARMLQWRLLQGACWWALPWWVAVSGDLIQVSPPSPPDTQSTASETVCFRRCWYLPSSGFHLKWWFSLVLPAISCPRWLELFHTTSPFRATVTPLSPPPHPPSFFPANTVLMWFNWLPSRSSSVVNLFC